MAYKLSKICVTMTALLTSAVCHAQGYDGYYPSYGNSADCCYQAPECAPTCAPACCAEYFIRADLLYLRAYEGGLEVCGPSESSDVINTDGSVTSAFRGKVDDLNFKWDPGYRIGAGYRTNSWDVELYWTHLYSKADRHGHEHSARWNLNFDVVDFLIGSDFYSSDCFTVRPYIGVRGARIRQRLHSFASETDRGTTDIARNRERFNGVGAITGFDAIWKLNCGLSLYADAAISCLYGRYRVRLDEAHTFPNAEDFCESRKHLQAVALVLDSAAGIRWEKCFCDNKRFMLSLGVEQHRYFDHNRMGCYGDLCLTGVVLSGGFGF